MDWELIVSLIITAPYFYLLVNVLLFDGLGRAQKPSEGYRDLPLRDEASGFVHASDKLAKIERAQRR